MKVEKKGYCYLFYFDSYEEYNLLKLSKKGTEKRNHFVFSNQDFHFICNILQNNNISLIIDSKIC